MRFSRSRAPLRRGAPPLAQAAISAAAVASRSVSLGTSRSSMRATRSNASPGSTTGSRSAETARGAAPHPPLAQGGEARFYDESTGEEAAAFGKGRDGDVESQMARPGEPARRLRDRLADARDAAPLAVLVGEAGRADPVRRRHRGSGVTTCAAGNPELDPPPPPHRLAHAADGVRLRHGTRSGSGNLGALHLWTHVARLRLLPSHLRGRRGYLSCSSTAARQSSETSGIDRVPSIATTLASVPTSRLYSRSICCICAAVSYRSSLAPRLRTRSNAICAGTYRKSVKSAFRAYRFAAWMNSCETLAPW